MFTCALNTLYQVMVVSYIALDIIELLNFILCMVDNNTRSIDRVLPCINSTRTNHWLVY